MRRSPPRPRKQYTVGEQIFGYGCGFVFVIFGTLVVIFYTLADLVIRFLKSPITWIVAGIVAGIVVIVVVGYNLYIYNEKRIDKIFLSESAFRKKHLEQTWANGDQYIGELKDNKRHGQGTFTYTNEDQYIGEYKDDKRHGQGTYTYSDGDQYIGELKDNKFHGQGTFTYSDGTSDKGIWEDDEYIG